MDNVAMQSIIQQMRSAATAASGGPANNSESAPSGSPAFSQALVQALDKVNDIQQEAGSMATRFELGDPNVSLPQVMVSLEKSSVAFEATRQVRNRLVNAYKEIMNMPI